MDTQLQLIAENIFFQRYPLKLLGFELGRNVTLIRLKSGKVIIHSSAPFSVKDKQTFVEVGDPTWLFEATNFHDTFAKEGRRIFPDLPYFVPDGFPGSKKLEALEIQTTPQEWDEEISIIPIQGIPKLNEHAIFHRPSKTLIVADLVFNLGPNLKWWTNKVYRKLSGIKEDPGMSKLLFMYIKDKEAFKKSLQELLGLDFQTLIPAHGIPMTEDPRTKLIKLFESKDLL